MSSRNWCRQCVQGGFLCLLLGASPLSAGAQAADPPKSAAAPSQPANESDYETVRLSRPDGSVVYLRVPRHQPMTLRLHRPAISTRVPRPERPDSSGSAPVPIPAGSASRPVVSHPITGRGALSLHADVPLIAPHSVGLSERAGAPTVAGDDATQWRSGRGWAPGGELDDNGLYLSEDTESIVRLDAGDEFLSDTQPPDPIGDDAAPGYDADAIARWDVVPYQTIAGDFPVGILAFHMNGIDHVSVSLEGGPWTNISTMQINPRTGVREYVMIIPGDDPDLSEDELIEVRAIAYPKNVGTPRLLAPLFLYVNNSGTLTGLKLNVASGGSDATGDGSAAKPFGTIQKALNACNTNMALMDGAEIVITEPGRYDINQPAKPLLNSRWITIRPASGLSRDDVVIAAGSTTDLIRPNTQRLRFQNVTLDFSDMYQMYKEDPHAQWYDHCRWTYGQGWTYTPPASVSPVRNVGYGGLYITDSVAENMLYAFVWCNLVRNSHAEKISGDVFQNSLMVVDSSAHNIDGTVLSHHSDLLQYFGYFDNLIIYNVNASMIISTQNIFLDHANSTFTNCAFVNISVQNAQSDPPFSQLNSPHDHVLFYHISNPGQRFVLRDDMAGSKKFTAKNVFFRNCIVERIQAADYFGPIPEGVTIDHCHFNYNQPVGEKPTVGAIAIINSSGGAFEYKGYGASKIAGSGAFIPGYSDSETPDRGAKPWAPPQ
ncbi:MAG: hypothetical protein IPJ41_15180 [Phycisphaerales bacterium]|nr:hypothetical protein [Phycisphaerales bacterium]